MEPAVVRKLKKIYFRCRATSELCVYNQHGEGMHVIPSLIISEKLKPQVEGIRGGFSFSDPGPGWHVSTGISGESNEKCFVVHHPDVNVGTEKNLFTRHWFLRVSSMTSL